MCVQQGLAGGRLGRGLKLTKKAAKAKFDWENVEQIFDKLTEETDELKSAIEMGENIEEEIGDLLFVVVQEPGA